MKRILILVLLSNSLFAQNDIFNGSTTGGTDGSNKKQTPKPKTEMNNVTVLLEEARLKEEKNKQKKLEAEKKKVAENTPDKRKVIDLCQCENTANIIDQTSKVLMESELEFRTSMLGDLSTKLTYSECLETKDGSSFRLINADKCPKGAERFEEVANKMLKLQSLLVNNKYCLGEEHLMSLDKITCKSDAAIEEAANFLDKLQESNVNAEFLNKCSEAKKKIFEKEITNLVNAEMAMHFKPGEKNLDADQMMQFILTRQSFGICKSRPELLKELQESDVNEKYPVTLFGFMSSLKLYPPNFKSCFKNTFDEMRRNFGKKVVEQVKTVQDYCGASSYNCLHFQNYCTELVKADFNINRPSCTEKHDFVTGTLFSRLYASQYPDKFASLGRALTDSEHSVKNAQSFPVIGAVASYFYKANSSNRSLEMEFSGPLKQLLKTPSQSDRDVFKKDKFSVPKLDDAPVIQGGQLALETNKKYEFNYSSQPDAGLAFSKEQLVQCLLDIKTSGIKYKPETPEELVIAQAVNCQVMENSRKMEHVIDNMQNFSTTFSNLAKVVGFAGAVTSYASKAMGPLGPVVSIAVNSYAFGATNASYNLKEQIAKLKKESYEEKGQYKLSNCFGNMLENKAFSGINKDTIVSREECMDALQYLERASEYSLKAADYKKKGDKNQEIYMTYLLTEMLHLGHLKHELDHAEHGLDFAHLMKGHGARKNLIENIEHLLPVTEFNKMTVLGTTKQLGMYVNEYVSGQKFANYVDVMLFKFDKSTDPNNHVSSFPKGAIEHIEKSKNKIDLSSEATAKTSIEKLLEEYVALEMLKAKKAETAH